MVSRTGLIGNQKMNQGLTVGDLERILSLASSEGGSGRGMSFYSSASKCGRRALLTEQQSARIKSGEIPAPATKSAFMVGSGYHKLHELWRSDGLEGMTLDYNEPFTNPSVNEALRLFRGWQQFWPRDFWGQTLAIEAVLPSSDASKEAVRALFGDVVNAKPDMVVHLTAADVEHVASRVQLPGPGNYIIDWKTEDTPGADLKYMAGLQALWYPIAWELEHPDIPVEGVIFDIIYKHGRRKDKSITAESFHCVFASSALQSHEPLVGMIKQAQYNIANNIPNRSECIGFFDSCPFFNTLCDGT